MRSCIRCGVLCERGSYCKAHDPAKHYHTPSYRKLSRQVKEQYTGLPCPLCELAMVPPLRTPSIDHIIPLLQGGTDAPSNLRIICKRCNETHKGRTDAGGSCLTCGRALPKGIHYCYEHGA